MTKIEKEAQFNRHRDLLQIYAPQDSTIFTVPFRRNGEIIAAKFYVVQTRHNIRNITEYVATITNCQWDNKSGFLQTTSIQDVFELLSLKLYNKIRAFEYKNLD